MRYQRTAQFEKAFRKLPREIQEKAIAAFSRFREGFERPELHNQLHIKKVKGMEGIWEGRVDYHYRFTFHYETDPSSSEKICLFRNIGTHSILDVEP
jgi:mRNA-degrading endonuclease RelE of RelBE toxin-antitoxin system